MSSGASSTGGSSNSMQIFGLRNHGSSVDWNSNPFFKGYQNADTLQKNVQNQINSSWSNSHATDSDFLSYHQFNIHEQHALKSMGIKQRHTHTVDLLDTGLEKRTPVIRQQKNPSNVLPNGQSFWSSRLAVSNGGSKSE